MEMSPTLNVVVQPRYYHKPQLTTLLTVRPPDRSSGVAHPSHHGTDLYGTTSIAVTYAWEIRYVIARHCQGLCDARAKLTSGDALLFDIVFDILESLTEYMKLRSTPEEEPALKADMASSFRFLLRWERAQSSG
jgi:hypothetical protein